MKIKRLLLTSVITGWLGLVQPFLGLSQEKDSTKQNDDSNLNFNAKTDFFSKYIFNGINFSDTPVLQPSVNIFYDNFTLGAFLNFDIKTKRVDEADIILDYTRQINENLSLLVGYNLLTFINEDYNENVHEIYIGVSLSNLLNENLSVTKGFGDVDGSCAKLSLDKELDFDNFSISAGADLIYSNKYLTEKNGFSNLEFKLEIPIRLLEKLEFTPGIYHSKAINNEELKDETYYSGSLEFKF